MGLESDGPADDPYDLRRFVAAQDEGRTYDRALGEIRTGRKEHHWMWFVFPQIAGLAHSATARRFALSSVDEARAYLDHPVLGPRLRSCARAVAELDGTDAVQVFGPVDAVKLRSSMTLFARAAPDDPVFVRVLDQWFDGATDPRTDERV